MRQLGGRGLYGGIDSVEQHVTIHAKCHTVKEIFVNIY